MTEEQQQVVIENVKTTYENAGVEDVNVETASWFHRTFVGKGVGENIDIVFNNSADPRKGSAGGRATRGLGEGVGDVYENVLPEDDPNTPIDEKATAAANVGAHEGGHASKAELLDIEPSDGSVMSTRVTTEELGSERKDFNDQDKKKLQDVYNKKEDEDK